MDIKIIPISDFIRKFGEYTAILPKIDKLILTREGRPFAEIKATASEKNKKLLSMAGIWKDTELDDDTCMYLRNREELRSIIKRAPCTATNQIFNYEKSS